MADLRVIEGSGSPEEREAAYAEAIAAEAFEALVMRVKKTEVYAGKRAGAPTDVVDKLKTLERKNRELRATRPCVKLRLISPRPNSTAGRRHDRIH